MLFYLLCSSLSLLSLFNTACLSLAAAVAMFALTSLCKSVANYLAGLGGGVRNSQSAKAAQPIRSGVAFAQGRIYYEKSTE